MTLASLTSTPTTCLNLIDGRWRAPSSTTSLEHLAPYTNQPLTRVTVSSAEDVRQAVQAAQAAFPAWRATPLKERTAKLFRFRELLLADLEPLSQLAAAEAGKTLEEARAGILKGIEVTEFALSLQNLDSGASMEVSRGVSCAYRREPLGVVAGVVPFNFPAMVPLWMFPIAVTLGNCFILKPSEKVPQTACRMAQLMLDAGYAPGVFSIIQGARETAEQLAQDPMVKALAFVGSTPAARSLYSLASSQGKRALCLGGAKNVVIVVPDAEPELTVEGVVSSFTGCAGQRCMAASLLLAVGSVGAGIDALIAKVVERAASVQLGSEMGALIDKAAKERILSALERAQAEGAKLILDGRTAKPPPGYEQGNWLGACILDHATPQMHCATSELFGPVLSIIRVPDLQQALAIEQALPYGNACSVFTSSGAVARYVTEQASSGMVGINIGVPVPREPFSFGGTKASKFGHGDITGEGALDLWSERKKITSKWGLQADKNWMS
jgi:malonate-semialdehyde dehydrogenase (acetylating)/methylmalonate-semialdehyde dehydrogenase